MMFKTFRRLVPLCLSLALLVPMANATTTLHHRSSASSHQRKGGTARTQHVSGYTTKKGKVVKPYNRRPPN
jgi:hypothetical protein